jgi:dTMP kinase
MNEGENMLIAIEGIDGSGKGTQTKMLEKRLTSEGLGVTVFSFPRYSENFFGREVGNYLDGQFGGLEDVNPKFSALLYALDRFETRSQISNAIDHGNYVICDRYIGSNIAHQCARVPQDKFSELSTWIKTVEETILQTRTPDLVIFLDIEASQSAALVAKKDKRAYTEKTHDLHEASSDHLQNALNNFRQLASSGKWTTVFCNQPDGAMRSAQEISDEIYSYVRHKNDPR